MWENLMAVYLVDELVAYGTMIIKEIIRKVITGCKIFNEII